MSIMKRQIKTTSLVVASGGDIYNPVKDSVSGFLHRIDQIMYANKQLKKT